MPDGAFCRAPGRETGWCYLHDPETAEAATEGRRLGGLRRRRDEATLAGFFDLSGLRSPEDAQRLLEKAMWDTLEMTGSIQRSRTLVLIAREAARIAQTIDVKERLERLESILAAQRRSTTDPLAEDDDVRPR